MSKIKIEVINIEDLELDCVVNAANSKLRAGRGVCGAIFNAAGYDKLTAACDAIGGCKTGSSVITPGFDMKAKWIIHAVGPRYSDGKSGEEELLYSAYRSSLDLAVSNGIHSIGFPLISAGIYGYPVNKVWEVSIRACNDFIDAYLDYDMEIVFAVRNDVTAAEGNAEIQKQAFENVPKP